MAAYNKFYTFVADISNKVHDLATDQLTVFLTDTAPVATNTVIANITQIVYTNLSSRNITTSSSSQSSGLYKLMIANLTLTASGGSVGPFRYIGVYNSTAVGGPLIAWFDYGSEVTLNSGDSFAIDFDQTNGLLQIT